MDAETIELLQRRIAIQRQLLALSKENGIAFYRPHWLQHLFHSAASKRRGLFAGNRFGKSEANAAETAAWMRGERTWYKAKFDILGVDHLEGRNRAVVVKGFHNGHEEHPLVRQGIPSFPTKQLIVCTNWDKVHEIWTCRETDRKGKIWHFLPEGWATWSTTDGVISDIYGKNGSLLRFLSVDSYKRNQLVAESEDWDRVSFDEPGPEGLWQGAARGLVDRHGQGDFTLTSLEQMWIYDRFTGEGDKTFPAEHRFYLRATMFDNPHLTDEAIALYGSDLSDEEKQCRFFGLPLELSGLIYKEFRKTPVPDGHIIDTLPEGWRDFHYPDRRLIMYIRVDTHPVMPHAVSFFVVGPDDIPIQCHEIWDPADAESLAQQINRYLEDCGCFLGGIKVEPGAWIKDASTKRVAIAQVLREHGLPVRPASKDLTNGILQVRTALRNRKFFITKNCVRTIREFGRYRWDPDKGKPVDESDHFMENLYRLIIDKPRFFNPDTASDPIEEEAYVTADLSVSSLD